MLSSINLNVFVTINLGLASFLVADPLYSNRKYRIKIADLGPGQLTFIYLRSPSFGGFGSLGLLGCLRLWCSFALDRRDRLISRHNY